MLSKQEKKAAAEKFRERKCTLGAYAVRCTASARVWTGVSRNLEAARNAVWFSLRMGAHRDPPLQKEWQLHGEEAFQFEVLEALDEDTPAMLIPDSLKAMKQRWMATLNAPGLL